MSRKRDPRRAVMLDVAWPANRKLKGASAQTKLLDIVGLCWSGQNLTDGEIDPAVICALAGVPNKHATDLIKRGRWHKAGHNCPGCPQPSHEDDVVIHHYLIHQTSAEEFEDIMAKRSQTGRAANHKRHGHLGDVEECSICQK